ncbi:MULTISPECIES: helix-hairpin-helix domain-containing protein [Sporosarcina]|uniref:Competence protein ComEA n=2 Tax=Sporosarcina newyorkensis TaxID=759851 RepID=F9DNG9_9BACL|nr:MULTISPECIES: helix-hairpin-helix domain-containing protein [Sporosarcina]EGQ27603.1 competence protein ComEA [Sporosarcina newyorkensis 2681]MBY0220984.1 helix-hairpin-helix domain-containing protein [Sporosarcina aquimarina]
MIIPIAALAVLSFVLFFPREQMDSVSVEQGQSLFETLEVVEPIEEVVPPVELVAEAVSVAILVDVKGAVKHPGLYSLQEGDRLLDAVQKAGGYTEEADTRLLNHAQKLLDESVVYVPVAGEEPPAYSQPAATAVSATGGTQTAQVNINTANETEFQTLPGVGPSKAAAIVQYREEHGAFKQLDDLKNVSGIGDKTFEKLESSITLN